MLHRGYGFSILIFVFVCQTVSYELFAGLRMLALAGPRECLVTDDTAQAVFCS